MSADDNCPLCREPGGDLLWHGGGNRVVWAAQADYPGLCRVIAHSHVKEMSDLGPASRARTMEAVLAVEEALRDVLAPDKVNLASFGNVVPHLHWHVIPRFEDDAHFPNAIWSERLRDVPPRRLPPDFARLMAAALRVRLGDSAG